MGYAVTSNTVSLDAPLGGGDSIGDIVADSASESLDPRKKYDASLAQDLPVLLKCLKERERVVLTLRFGLDGNKEETLEGIGGKFGVTRERARQIQNIALRKLRKFLAKEYPEYKLILGFLMLLGMALWGHFAPAGTGVFAAGLGFLPLLFHPKPEDVNGGGGNAPNAPAMEKKENKALSPVSPVSVFQGIEERVWGEFIDYYSRHGIFGISGIADGCLTIKIAYASDGQRGVYEGLGYEGLDILWRYESLDLPGTGFVDLGSGDGRVALLYALKGYHSRGFEFAPGMFRSSVARASIDSLRGLRKFPTCRVSGCLVAPVTLMRRQFGNRLTGPAGLSLCWAISRMTKRPFSRTPQLFTRLYLSLVQIVPRTLGAFEADVTRGALYFSLR